MRGSVRLRIVLMLGFALLCLESTTFALDPSRRVLQYVHEKWGEDRGFVGGAIYAIGQSTDGYLWIGTERGLVRFDGSDFTLIQRPISNSPPIGAVRGFASDANGSLWIRLEGPRMLLYHDGKFEDPYARFDLQGLIPTISTADYQRRVILAGLGDRTLRYEDSHFKTILDARQSPGIVIALAAARDDSIWFGTREHGLIRLWHGQMSKPIQPLGNAKINCLFPAVEGNLWIGTDDGLYVLEVGATAAFKILALSGLQILAIAQDFDNNVWVGTNHGIARITSSGNVSLDLVDRKSENDVRAICQDSDGDIWFGGSQGIEQLRNGMFVEYSAADGLRGNGGGPLYIDSKGRVWFAPSSGGVFLIGKGKARSIALAGLDRDVAYSISGGGNEIWIGRERGGLTALTESGDSFAAHTYLRSDGLAQDSVYSVRRSRNGTVWAGTVSSGISRLSNGKFMNYSDSDGLPSTSVNSIVEGSDGKMWVATSNGLTSYANGKWKNYSSRDGLPSPFVRTIFEDSSRRLWIGSAAGLAYLSSAKIIVPANLPEILREQILGIGADSLGFLWIITSDHVVRVNRDRLVLGSLLETDIQSFGVNDGLVKSDGVARDQTVVEDRGGRIWLSLRSGLFMADPNISKRSLVPAVVRVESVSAGGRQFDTESLLKIPPGIQSITLKYGDTNLSAPERIRFRYKLDGSGQGWSEIVASKQVVFSNLGPGSYRFRIEASNSVGLWNGPETSIPFVIDPAFWQTWWFRVSCTVVVLAVLWAVYIARVRNLATLLQLRHQERLSEREDIARDLHDTFFQAVQSLFLRIHTASRQLPQESSARRAIEAVLDESDRVMTDGREMFLDIPNKNFVRQDFGGLIAGYCAEFANAHPIEYMVQVDGQSRSLDPLVTTELSKIAREGIYNAFRHSKAKAIEVELTYGRRELQLRIRDNGQGFEPALIQSNSGYLHLGLENMRKRAKKLDADFRLWSRLGSGTELEVILAAHRAYNTTERKWPFFGSQHK